MTPQNLRTFSRWLRRLANESPDVHPRVACDLANWLSSQADEMEAAATPQTPAVDEEATRKAAESGCDVVVFEVPQPPAAGVTLTDAEREVLTHVRDIYSANSNIPHCARIAFTIDGLLSRATKEGR